VKYRGRAGSHGHVQRYEEQERNSCHSHMVVSKRRDERKKGKIESFLFLFLVIES